MVEFSKFLKASVGFLAAASVHAIPIQHQPRGIISSDAIVGFAQTVPGGVVGSSYLAYKPYLKVVNGCVPFPAVDAAGNTKSVAIITSVYRKILT